ncbi:BAI1-associated protein 3-like isoform X3 [Petromyzon marinus]|uniref:BAI1-associated protein 3-like isoform X3 n=1 Tax=Petromyzon marinus TaxID=7757 RepID=UPI003F702502
MQRTSRGSLRNISQIANESLLYEEALYTIRHQWKPNSERDGKVKTLLDQVFPHVMHAEILHKVQAAKPPAHFLKIIVEEPTNHNSKTASATSYTAQLVSKAEIGRRGSSSGVLDADESSTDSPHQPASATTDQTPHHSWRHAFKLDLTDGRDKELLLNFWKISQERHFLEFKSKDNDRRESKKRHSSVVVPLSNMDRPETIDCYSLLKKKNGRCQDKGTCRVSVSYSTEQRDTSLSRDPARPSSQVYELLLQALVEWEYNEQQQKPLWDGKLSEEASDILLLYGCQADLPTLQMLAQKWSVYMKQHNKKPLDIKLFKDLFTGTVNIWTNDTENDGVKEAVLEFTKQRLASLQQLEQHFPNSSKDALKQLKETLWLLEHMNNSKIIQGNSRCLKESIEREIAEGANVWYTSKKKTCEIFRHQKKDFMQAMAKLCELIEKELSTMEKYNNVFTRVVYMNYRAVWSRQIEGMLAQDIRRSTEETQTVWEKADESVGDRCKKEKDLASAMHSLYISLQAVNKRLDRSLKDQPQPLASFHEWFLGAINAWAKTVHWKTESIVRNALEKDNLMRDHPAVRHSSSVHDLLSWFVGMRDFWVELAWPDPDITSMLVCKLIEEICDASVSYVTLMRARLVAEGFSGGNGQVFVMSAKICVGLCSIHHLQCSLPSLLGSLIDKKPQTETDGAAAAAGPTASTGGAAGRAAAALAPAAQKAPCSSVLDSGIHDLDKQMEDTVRAMAEQTMLYIKSHLEAIASDAAVKIQDESVYEYYDNNLKQLFEGLNENSKIFQIFLYMLWETVLKAFSEELEKNRICSGFMKDRRSSLSSPYYTRMQTMLKKLLQVFNVDVRGIKMEFLQNDVYKGLEEQLELRQKSTPELIDLYHQEKAKRQVPVEEATQGMLDVECHYDGERAALVVKLLGVSGLPGGSSQKVQVKLQLCPREFFSTVKTQNSRSMTSTGRDNGGFNETFEFAVSEGQCGCPEAYLVFELWRTRLLSRNLQLGRAVMYLSRATGAAGQISLPLQLPDVNESQVLQILEKRRDPVARNFFKNLK